MDRCTKGPAAGFALRDGMLLWGDIICWEDEPLIWPAESSIRLWAKPGAEGGGRTLMPEKGAGF